MVVSSEERGIFKPFDYIQWYRLAEEVFCDLIPKLSDQEIIMQSPKRGSWFPVPLASEKDLKDVANRPDPHIDFKLACNEKIRIGMRCNTIASVEKMRNILSELQTTEKQEFLAEMSKLDDSFRTQVLTKIKETNYAQVDSYECKFIEQSNKVNDQVIDQIFQEIDEIRKEGKRRLKEEQLKLNPETPVLDITFTTVQQSPYVFKEKLAQIKKMYQICLRIKTSGELQTERRKMRKNVGDQWITKFRCSKCGKEYARSTEKLRFCGEDGMRIISVKEKANSQ